MHVKHKLILLTTVVFIIITLTACQNEERNTGVDKNSSADPTNEAQLDNNESSKSNKKDIQSQPSDETEKERADQESQLTDNNYDYIKKVQYSTEEEAINSIDEYREVKQTNLDLGYGIEAFTEGAAGHFYTSWNEGDWLIEINFPSDPQYAIDNYENGEELAKDVVTYLEDHYLPAPDDRGIIKINAFKEHPEVTIKWQLEDSVYEINEANDEPLNILQYAVDYEKFN